MSEATWPCGEPWGGVWTAWHQSRVPLMQCGQTRKVPLWMEGLRLKEKEGGAGGHLVAQGLAFPSPLCPPVPVSSGLGVSPATSYSLLGWTSLVSAWKAPHSAPHSPRLRAEPHCPGFSVMWPRLHGRVC